jgi:hypothetical protein
MPVFELLCDGKVTIFECGEEKHSLGAKNGNQTHVMWLNRDGTLCPCIQTTCTSIRDDVRLKVARGPFATRRDIRLTVDPPNQKRPRGTVLGLAASIGLNQEIRCAI